MTLDGEVSRRNFFGDVSMGLAGIGLVHLIGRDLRAADATRRSEEHTSELQSRRNLVCRLLLEKKNKTLTSLLLLQ